MKTMKEYETLKIYGEKVNRWTAWDENKGREVTTQIEVEYKEYDTTGKLVAIGTEDFTVARYIEQLNDYSVWGWDGSHMNRGGHKYFERLMDCRKVNRKDVYKLRQIAGAWFAEKQFAEIQVRSLF